MKNILNKHRKPNKEKYKIHVSNIKGAPGSEMELNPEFKDIKSNEGSSDLGARFHPAKLMDLQF